MLRCFYCFRSPYSPRRCVCVRTIRHGDLGTIMAWGAQWQVFKAMLRVLDVRDRGLQTAMEQRRP